MQVAFVIGALAGVSGCIWATPESQKIRGLEAHVLVSKVNHFGGGVQAMTATAGVQITAALDQRSLAAHENSADIIATALSLSMRLSLPGLLPTDHHVDRFLDGGIEVGGGINMVVGTANVSSGPERFGGLWFELGNIDLDEGYIAFTVGARAVTRVDELPSGAAFSFGVAWRGRRKVRSEDIRWR